MESLLSAPARLSRLAAAAAAKHPDCPDLADLVTALTERELADARAAHSIQVDFTPPPVAWLSRLATAAAARSPGCLELGQVAAALRDREVTDAQAARRARWEYDAASRRLDRQLALTWWIASGMSAIAAVRILARLAGWG